MCLDLVCGLNASLFNRVRADNYVDTNILFDDDIMVSELYGLIIWLYACKKTNEFNVVNVTLLICLMLCKILNSILI